MTDKPETALEIEQYKTDLSRMVVAEVVDIIAKEAKGRGDEFFYQTCLVSMASLICTLLYNRTNSIKKVSDNVKDIDNAYFTLKHAIELAVASGFESFFHQFSQLNSSFKCDIMPTSSIPDPINSKEYPC